MIKIAIIGSGDLGLQILNLSHHIKNIEVVGFFDDLAKKGEIVEGIPILGGISEVDEAFTKNLFDQLSLAIGYKHFEFREKTFNQFQNKIPFVNLIHPTSFIDTTAELGEGIIIFANVTIDYKCSIKDNVLVNIGSTIAHHTAIGEHSFLSPRVALAGFITVGAKCNLGIGSIIIDNISLCSQVQLGAGAVVIENIKEQGLYLGIPARRKT